MMPIRSYLRQHRRGIALYAVFCAIFAVTFRLYALPLRAVWYPAVLCAAIGAGCLTADCIRVRRRHEMFLRAQKHCADLLTELPRPESVAEEDYAALAAALREQMQTRQADADARYRDMMDYYTVWVHQIKTPIASMRLTLQSEDSAMSRKLSLDLLRIEQYVEMVLAYLRLDATTSDYVFRTCEVDEIVRRSVKKFAAEFIARRLRLTYEPLRLRVVTDEKWLGFVLDQLLSNALKYTQEGGVRIYADGQSLCIEDSGIGIAPEDLPRIFDKGYTGCNGRLDRRATGIGLYLCRRSCKNLGIAISAVSAPGRGTTMRLDLSQKAQRKE